MNDCLYCLIYGDGEHPGECLSINSKEGREKYDEYDKEIDIEIDKVRDKWMKKLELEED